MIEKAGLIADVCNALTKNNVEEARAIIEKGYPFSSITNNERRYTDEQKLRVYIQDGFIDRYSGQRLIYTPVLRVLSHLYPTEFPYHPNWKMSACHIAYWELTPTIDHMVPIARGGADDASNWVTTSMLRNAAKANWTIEELAWQLVPAGDLREWDGLLHWFVGFMEAHGEMKKLPPFGKWYRVAKRAIASK